MRAGEGEERPVRVAVCQEVEAPGGAVLSLARLLATTLLLATTVSFSLGQL